MLGMLLSGCSSQEHKSKTDYSRELPTIGMCFDTFTIERWLKDRDVFTFTAKNLGEVVEVQNANGNVQKQREQIEHFIEIGVKAMVIVSVDADQISDLVKEAHDKGIKIIAYDRLIEDAPVDLYISFDNYKVGYEMASAMNEYFVKNSSKSKRVIMVEGPNSDKNVAMVRQGFMDCAKRSEFEIVEQTNIEGWRAEKVSDYFKMNPDILQNADAIMCGNDSLAGEVVHILSEKRLAGSVFVSGQDADLDACQRITEGTQSVTIYKPVEQMAKQAAEYTVELINGNNLSETITTTINNRYSDVLYVALNPIYVDKDNLDEVIIESGFHLREDVYRNVSGAE